MESNDKLKEINVKNRVFYYFDDIIKIEDFHLDNILVDENRMQILQFITFRKKVQLILSLCILGLIKQMNLLEFLTKLDIQFYLEVKNMIPFTTDQLFYKYKKQYYIYNFS